MAIVSMKRWIALVLAALLVVSIIPAAAASGDEQPQPEEAPAITAATLIGDVTLDGKVDVMDVTGYCFVNFLYTPCAARAQKWPLGVF